MPTIKKPEFIDRGQFLGDVMQDHHTQAFTPASGPLSGLARIPTGLPSATPSPFLWKASFKSWMAQPKSAAWP